MRCSCSLRSLPKLGRGAFGFCGRCSESVKLRGGVGHAGRIDHYHEPGCLLNHVSVLLLRAQHARVHDMHLDGLGIGFQFPDTCPQLRNFFVAQGQRSILAFDQRHERVFPLSECGGCEFTFAPHQPTLHVRRGLPASPPSGSGSGARSARASIAAVTPCRCAIRMGNASRSAAAALNAAWMLSTNTRGDCRAYW